MKKILLYGFLTLILLSIAATYYRYVVVRDFELETKPMDEFVADDF